MWWMLTATAIIRLPLIFFVGRPQPIGWAIILVSGLIEAVYFITLTRACALGDLAQVYPLARGSAPLFLGKALVAGGITIIVLGG